MKVSKEIRGEKPGLKTFLDGCFIFVRPHKRSDANLKRLTRAGSANANPNVVRVPSCSSW